MSEESDYIIETNEPDKPNKFPVFQQFGLLVLVLLLLFGGTYLPKTLEDKNDGISANTSDSAIKKAEHTQSIKVIDKISDVEVYAQAAYVWDVATQRVLYSKNENEPLPLASITKLMTALMAYELVDFDESADITAAAIRQEGDSGLYQGERFSIKELMDYALLASSNDAAYTLSAAAGEALFPERGSDAFIDAMNIRSQELGLTSLEFYNSTGLDISATKAGAYGSARDISFLMEYIVTTYPDLLDITQSTNDRIYNQAGEYHDANNTNDIVNEIPNLIGSKTGYTDLAGGNLTVAYAAGLNRPIIITVLGSTINGRFTDVDTLIKAVGESFKE